MWIGCLEASVVFGKCSDDTDEDSFAHGWHRICILKNGKMKKWKIICICLTALLFCVSCSNDEPDSLAPDITLNEATAITSTSASLKASVSQNGGKIGTCIFFVATDSLFLNNMKQFPVTLTSNMASVVVESLSPNVTYFYKFQVSSGYSLAVSKVKTFTTLAGPVVPSAPDIVLKDAALYVFVSELSAYVQATGKIVSCSLRSVRTRHSIRWQGVCVKLR